MIESEAPAVAVVDIRLVDDTDEKDVSGLTLAKETDPSIPKIILTGFPTYDAVREALGPSLNGLPLAVGFVAKNEGLYKLLAAIQLANTRLNPRVESRLLRSVGVRALAGLVNRMNELGPSELARMMQESYGAVILELSEQINRLNRQADQLHWGGMICGWIAFALVVAVFAAAWLRFEKTILILTAASSIAKIAGGFFYRRESEARRRLNQLNEELRLVERERCLPLLANAFEKADDRDEYRKQALDYILKPRSGG
jgi:hypothetical protein